MRTLNLGILAHVDAGKTSLTERLLLGAGVIDELGSVDHGSTQTDSLALERRRGITIKSAVVSFRIDDVTVNLIDTPGHPDFIAEVERVLSLLDGAVLVVSAVEGVQAQTRLLMRTLRRLRIPTLIFVNKIDRSGADGDRVLGQLRDRLTPDVVPLGSVCDQGTKDAAFRPFARTDRTLELTEHLVQVLAERDDAVLAAYLDDAVLELDDLLERLRDLTGLAQAHPVFFGSAITGAGVQELTTAITGLLPARQRPDHGPVSGTVFKVERGPAGERIAWVHLTSGTVHRRERLELGPQDLRKVTAIGLFEAGQVVDRPSLAAGRIAKLWGLGEVRIGDSIGPDRAAADRLFAPPTLETVVLPEDRAQQGRLHAALRELAEQDPLINLRQDDDRSEISVSLFGEIQKEVIQATLADSFGIGVRFRETTTLYVERPAGTGTAVELIGADGNPFLATVGLRIEPAPIGAGTDFRLEVEPGSMPASFFTAVSDSVHDTLRRGLHGRPVIDTSVTMTRSGYWARQSHAHGVFDKSMSSTAGDFRGLTAVVLRRALAEAGSVVCEPIHRFELEVPADTLGLVLPLMARLRAIPGRPTVPVTKTVSGARIEGEIPAVQVHELNRRLPALTRGEGVLESAFDHYRPARGSVPNRPGPGPSS